MKSWLQDNNIEIYLVHNEEKSVAVERFIRNLKNKIYRCMTSVSRNLPTNKLDNIVFKYNNTGHKAIKIKPIDVKSSSSYSLFNDIIFYYII